MILQFISTKTVLQYMRGNMHYFYIWTQGSTSAAVALSPLPDSWSWLKSKTESSRETYTIPPSFHVDIHEYHSHGDARGKPRAP